MGADHKLSLIHIYINFMKKIALFLFLISFCCTMVMEIDKLLFMQGKDYAQVYSLYKNEFPIVIRVMSTILPYFLCFFLACNPNKKSTYIVLIVYIVSGLPGFIIGARSALMIKVMFSFLYFMIRENNDNIEVWINKFEKIIIIVIVPVSIIGLGAFSYIRDGSNSNSDNRNILVDFFYLQGTSFDTLCEAFEFKDELKTKDVTSYTFGNIIDYVQHSTMSQILFNAEPLPSGNNITMATKSNSLAHHLSYVVLGDTYLMGHGRGSVSYTHL